MMDDNEALMIYFFFTTIIGINKDLDLHCFDEEIPREGIFGLQGLLGELIYQDPDIRKEFSVGFVVNYIRSIFFINEQTPLKIQKLC